MIELQIGKIHCYLTDVWGEYEDDIQFLLQDVEGDEITDEEVYDYVRDMYYGVIHTEWVENQIARAEAQFDADKG